jgi:hypothetical protein
MTSNDGLTLQELLFNTTLIGTNPELITFSFLLEQGTTLPDPEPAVKDWGRYARVVHVSSLIHSTSKGAGCCRGQNT